MISGASCWYHQMYCDPSHWFPRLVLQLCVVVSVMLALTATYQPFARSAGPTASMNDFIAVR